MMKDATGAVRTEQVEKARQQFQAVDLTPAEGLMAAAGLLLENIKAFRAEAPSFRARCGEAETRRFATEELNDLIYDLQDSIQPLLKTYNSLLRDPSQKHDAPGE